MSFEIRTAVRQGARLLIQLSGVSGSGKTYTALQLAYGLAGRDAKKVVLIDTENRRGSLYAGCLPEPFRVLDFYAPFSPERYIKAITAAVKAGAEVVVIDSVSHEWEGPGGCQEIADRTRPKLPDWKTAKAEHKRFMTHMLQSSAHVIACTRAREKTDFSNPKEPRSLGIQPIQEQNFSFEATVSLMMHDQGVRQDVLKCPAELSGVMGRGTGYLGIDDGLALRAWVDGAEPVNPKVEHHRGLLLNAAEQGVESLREEWGRTPKAVQKALGAKFLESVKASAQAFDDSRRSAPAEDDDPFGAANAAAQQHSQQRQTLPPDQQAPAAPADPADDDDGGIFP